MPEIHTYVMLRLSRWAIWCIWRADLLTARPGPRHVKSWWHAMITLPRMKVADVVIVDRKPCPVDEMEAGATDLCVQQLSERLRYAVVLSYLDSSTAEEKAKTMGCDRSTYFRRLDRAYTSLLGLMNDYEVGMDRVDVEKANAERATA